MCGSSGAQLDGVGRQSGYPTHVPSIPGYHDVAIHPPGSSYMEEEQTYKYLQYTSVLLLYSQDWISR